MSEELKGKGRAYGLQGAVRASPALVVEAVLCIMVVIVVALHQAHLCLLYAHRQRREQRVHVAQVVRRGRGLGGPVVPLQRLVHAQEEAAGGQAELCVGGAAECGERRVGVGREDRAHGVDHSYRMGEATHAEVQGTRESTGHQHRSAGTELSHHSGADGGEEGGGGARDVGVDQHVNRHAPLRHGATRDAQGARGRRCVGKGGGGGEEEAQGGGHVWQEVAARRHRDQRREGRVVAEQRVGGHGLQGSMRLHGGGERAQGGIRLRLHRHERAIEGATGKEEARRQWCIRCTYGTE